jgi:hypothetical protein
LTKEQKIFSFDKQKTKSGAIAQLGERLNGIQEVRSSILLSSTIPGVDLQYINAFLINDNDFR